MAEKRPRRPSDDTNGAGQMIVKRQNVGTSTALAQRGGPPSGALIQSVSQFAVLVSPGRHDH